MTAARSCFVVSPYRSNAAAKYGAAVVDALIAAVGAGAGQRHDGFEQRGGDDLAGGGVGVGVLCAVGTGERWGGGCKGEEESGEEGGGEHLGDCVDDFGEAGGGSRGEWRRRGARDTRVWEKRASGSNNRSDEGQFQIKFLCCN